MSADGSIQKNLKLSWKEDAKKRKIRSRYNWTMSINKELFQFPGKKKTPDFMPNGFAGTVFGQGLPPVKVKKKKNRRNWQRHQFHFFIRAWKIAISRPIFFRKNNIYVSADAQQNAEQNMSAVAWRCEQPKLSYLPSKSKNSHFCPSDTKICVFGQQSRRFGQNVSRTKFLQYVQEAVCQFSAKSVGNFPKSSKFTPQLPSYKCSAVFSITLAQGALP